MVSFDSPFYPYERVTAENALKGAELVPMKLLRYLLDLPDAEGYTPVDDNSRPRVRFAKYLWYDGEDPLSQPLPTPQEKLSLLYDPKHPDVNSDEEKAAHPKGYRLLWQRVRQQSVTEAQTLVKCYFGRIFNPRPFLTTMGVTWEIWVASGFETNLATEVYSRSFAIEQCIREALAGVNLTGIGAVSFDRTEHAGNGSENIYNQGSMTGRLLGCSISWSDAGENVTNGMCWEC